MKRFALFMMAFIAATPACNAPQAEREIRTALDVVARAVDPAYDFAVDACLARQNLVAAAAEAKEIGGVEADRQIAAIRHRCDRARATFDLIRRSHDEAHRLIDAGHITEAERRLDAIVEAWRSLKGGTEE